MTAFDELDDAFTCIDEDTDSLIRQAQVLRETVAEAKKGIKEAEDNDTREEAVEALFKKLHFVNDIAEDICNTVLEVGRHYEAAIEESDDLYELRDSL